MCSRLPVQYSERRRGKVGQSRLWSVDLSEIIGTRNVEHLLYSYIIYNILYIIYISLYKFYIHVDVPRIGSLAHFVNLPSNFSQKGFHGFILGPMELVSIESEENSEDLIQVHGRHYKNNVTRTQRKRNMGGLERSSSNDSKACRTSTTFTSPS